MKLLKARTIFGAISVLASICFRKKMMAATKRGEGPTPFPYDCRKRDFISPRKSPGRKLFFTFLPSGNLFVPSYLRDCSERKWLEIPYYARYAEELPTTIGRPVKVIFCYMRILHLQTPNPGAPLKLCLP